jgi:hypothetical protein
MVLVLQLLAATQVTKERLSPLPLLFLPRLLRKKKKEREGALVAVLLLLLSMLLACLLAEEA